MIRIERAEATRSDGLWLNDGQQSSATGQQNFVIQSEKT